MFRTPGCSVIVVLILALLVGCSQEQSIISSKEESKQIVVAVTQDAEGDKLDAATYNGSRHTHAAVYDALVEYEGEGKLAPSLAESWEVSDDGKIYSFHLKEQVKFSDGSPLNAAAVKFSLERAISREENATLEISRLLKTIETPDDSTVVLTFKETATQVLYELSQARPFRIMSPNSVTPAGDVNGTFQQAIGTGPWKIGSYKQGVETVLVANEYYWAENPSEYSLVFKVITDPQARVLALQSGEVDLAGGELGNVPAESLSVFQNNEKFVIETGSSTMSYFLVLNQNNADLSEKNIRQAINYGNDTSKYRNGSDETVKGLFQQKVAFVTDDNQPFYSYDPGKAKPLIEASGYAWNEKNHLYEKDGRALQLRLVIQTEEYPEWKEMAEIFQDNMKQIGIQVDIVNQERAAYYDTLWSSKDYDLLMYRTYADAQLPYRFLSSLFYNSSSTPGVAFQDAPLSDLLDQIADTVSVDRQQALFDQVFLRMHEEVMSVPMYYTKQTFVHKRDVVGFAFNAIEDNPLKWHHLKKEAQ
ncbi:peptide/nickel transport system substrate-binding protein [Fontibacillus phaseoli]|uniref:Peptide/nickel transport system substrate-binding protein n=1 Tax=Fontibacillus phaseoli TaxID=1416533 RepID=A0A369B168_9BACL|nr:ABC transporter substrate-binding protein [Fontibacillus phaseoli]RCX15420.1 peptide/nickel transport system substrate-binding protein [Fontibacillus phaseoli]